MGGQQQPAPPQGQFNTFTPNYGHQNHQNAPYAGSDNFGYGGVQMQQN